MELLEGPQRGLGRLEVTGPRGNQGKGLVLPWGPRSNTPGWGERGWKLPWGGANSPGACVSPGAANGSRVVVVSQHRGGHWSNTGVQFGP